MATNNTHTLRLDASPSHFVALSSYWTNTINIDLPGFVFWKFVSHSDDKNTHYTVRSSFTCHSPRTFISVSYKSKSINEVKYRLHNYKVHKCLTQHQAQSLSSWVQFKYSLSDRTFRVMLTACKEMYILSHISSCKALSISFFFS
jgi:hypothetical protein